MLYKLIKKKKKMHVQKDKKKYNYVFLLRSVPGFKRNLQGYIMSFARQLKEFLADRQGSSIFYSGSCLLSIFCLLSSVINVWCLRVITRSFLDQS